MRFGHCLYGASIGLLVSSLGFASDRGVGETRIGRWSHGKSGVVEHALARHPASRNRMPEAFLEKLNRSSHSDPRASRKEYVQSTSNGSAGR